MKRKDLIDNIEGSRLKKQFLEAFLLQSAFIEGLLKKLVEDNFFSKVSLPIMMAKLKETPNSFTEPKEIVYLKEKLLRQNLYEIIEHLSKVEVIDDELKKQLHFYRDRRNSILHDLVGKMSKQEFEKEIEELVSKGVAILNNHSMVAASESVRQREEIAEVIESGDEEKLKEYLDALGEKSKKLPEV